MHNAAAFAAIAPSPGWSLPLMFYNYGGSKGAERVRQPLGRHFLVNFNLTSEIWRGMGTAPSPRGNIMRYQ
jgi:hypothetical protein